MAEYGGAETFYRVCNIPRLTAVTAGAIFFGGDIECFYTAMARSAGFGLLHFGHSKAFFIFQAVDRIVAHFTVIIVFFQMEFMAENDRPGIFKGKSDILVLGRPADGSSQK